MIFEQRMLVVRRIACHHRVQMMDTGSKWRVQLQAEQLQELQAAQQAFERRKQQLAVELAERVGCHSMKHSLM